MSARSLVTPRSVSKTRRDVIAWTVAIASAAYWLIDLAVLRGGTPAPLDDSWELVCAARELVLGHGFRTPMIHPPLWGLHDANNHVPVLVHGPLLPLALAPFVRVMGANAVDAVAWLAAACWVGAGVLTFRVASRAFGRGAAGLAAFVVTASPLALRMTHHDVAPAAGALFAAWVLDLVARPHPHAFIVGLALGFGSLVRPEFMLALPIVWMALGVRSAPGLVLGWALPVAPWALHTFRATGSPAFNLSSYLLIGFTPSHPGFSPMSDFELTPQRFGAALAATLPELPAKWAHMAPRAVRHMLAAPSASLGWLAAAGAWSALRAPEFRRRAALCLAAAAIPFVVVTLTESSERYVAEFLPLWALGVAGGLEALREGVAPRVPPGAARALAAAVLLMSTLPALIGEAANATMLRVWLAGERAGLAEHTSAHSTGSLMFSDTPDFVAWTTGHATIYVERADYMKLPGPGSWESPLPARGGPADEWFHADLRAVPSPTPGADVQSLEAAEDTTRAR